MVYTNYMHLVYRKFNDEPFKLILITNFASVAYAFPDHDRQWVLDNWAKRVYSKEFYEDRLSYNYSYRYLKGFTKGYVNYSELYRP